MKATIDLKPEAYRRAQEIAEKDGRDLGEVISDAVLGQFGEPHQPRIWVEVDAGGVPRLHTAEPVRLKDVRAAIEAD